MVKVSAKLKLSTSELETLNFLSEMLGKSRTKFIEETVREKLETETLIWDREGFEQRKRWWIEDKKTTIKDVADE